MAGDIQHSDTKYLTAIANMERWKFPVIRVHAKIAGNPRALPIMQILALVILLFFSNLSLRIPPMIVDENPIPATINALYSPYSALKSG